MDQGAKRVDGHRPRGEVLCADRRRTEAVGKRAGKLGSAVRRHSADCARSGVAMYRWLTRLELRIRSIFRGAAVDASMRSELEVHLAEQIEEYIATGMTAAEARQAALRDFGPVARIEEE